ncbi:MAG: hypothetical protein HY077_16255 [Elusimicrobia bacterium]|nr:hypothetical protein [Elusimicrobiota bacterium]
MRPLGPLIALAAWALSASGPATAGTIGDCPGGCPARESLSALAESAPGRYGGIYENSRSSSESPETPEEGPNVRKPAELPTLRPAVAGSRVVPAAEKESKEHGGFMGFLDKHKWQIGGAAAGALLTFFMPAGLLGLLAGLVLSIAISFLGPKLFSSKKQP